MNLSVVNCRVSWKILQRAVDGWDDLDEESRNDTLDDAWPSATALLDVLKSRRGSMTPQEAHEVDAIEATARELAPRLQQLFDAPG